MKISTRGRILGFLAALLVPLAILFAAEGPDIGPSGYQIGKRSTDRVGFHGTSPTTQRTAAAQAAVTGTAVGSLTDSTTGTASTTLAAGVGVYNLTIPVTLPVGGTGAADQLTTLTLGHKFKILAWEYVEAVATTGTTSSRVYNMEIGTTDVGTTPSTITITTASAAVGRVIAGTTVTGANTGSASAQISIEVASGGTTHDAGSGAFVLRIQNMDTADAAAELALLGNALAVDTAANTTLANELRAALVAKGLILGQ